MSKRVKSKGRSGSRAVGPAERALAEYEEIQRLRAETKEVPPMSSNEKALRDAAIAIIDETCLQYAEMYRIGRCPACECILTWRDVDKQPEHEVHEALAGHEASRYLEWTSKHLPDCGFMERYRELPDLAARFHIDLAQKVMEVRMQDGGGKVMRDLVPVRVPAAGDPQVEDR